MTIIEFVPKKGILHVDFGMTRDKVKEIMKTKYKAKASELKGADTDCYFESSLQFSFESDNTLSFIEAYAPPPIGVRLLDINTWEISGEELFDLLSKVDQMNETISEGGSNPIFQKNIITLWELDEQYDNLGGYKSKKWGAIGIGDERYYKQICDLYK
jgi:hypothetical protein